MLDLGASAVAREQPLNELAGVALGDDLDRWAYRRLPTKNTLVADDARLVEDAFRAKLAAPGDPPGPDGSTASSPVSGQPSAPLQGPLSGQEVLESKDSQTRTNKIEKSLLAIPEPRRLRDKQHLRFVARQPCLICGRQPCDAHHLRFAQSRGLGLKVSDQFTVPLCRAHHRELHGAGKEADWRARLGLKPLPFARSLWVLSHPLPSSNAVQAESLP